MHPFKKSDNTDTNRAPPFTAAGRVISIAGKNRHVLIPAVFVVILSGGIDRDAILADAWPEKPNAVRKSDGDESMIAFPARRQLTPALHLCLSHFAMELG